MHFVKMEGCGNDYVYVDGSSEKVDNKPEIVRRLSDRHFGIGGDGVIFVNPGKEAEFEMEMYNADGSRSEMCGNGIRCVAKFVYDRGLTRSNPVTIESFGSVKTLELHLKNDKVETVTVNMGKPILLPKDIPAVPLNADDEMIIDQPMEIDGKVWNATCVSMGNPHAVFFVDDNNYKDFERMGPLFEHDKHFPKAVNAEFIKVIDESHIDMRVWERGTGETLACGTGACASVVACILNGKTGRKVEVTLRGGKLNIEWCESDGCVYMTGPATTVFEGDVEI
ncbi:MAG: diaminopimelate epimerase [Lachnospiraceae bacterium]|nr:diaminopimelate epimerase [Lachnospiraceae bacterium]